MHAPQDVAILHRETRRPRGWIILSTPRPCRHATRIARCTLGVPFDRRIRIRDNDPALQPGHVATSMRPYEVIA